MSRSNTAEVIKPDRMKKITLFFLAFLLCSCEKDVPVGDTKHSYYRNHYYNSYADSSLTVLTYNVQLGFTNYQDPWDKNQTGGSAAQIHDIAEIIRRVDPDIVALQEVPIDRSNSIVKHFIEALADSLRMNFAFGGHSKNDPYGVWPVHGVWGNATLSKFPIVEIENIEVYYKGMWNRRSVLRSRISLNENLSVDVFNLHHAAKEDSEMERTKNFLATSTLPVLIAGDFNRRYADPTLSLLSNYQDLFNSHISGIDRIYSNFNDTVFGTGGIVGSNIVSDHMAYYAKIRLNAH